MIPASWIVTGALTVAVGAYVWHCEHVKEERAKAAAVFEEQARQNALQALRDLKKKERSDENYKLRIERLAADVKRLRERPSILPAAPASTSRPDLACFDRAELDTALRRYREGVVGLVGEGTAAVEGLDAAKEWAQGR